VQAVATDSAFIGRDALSLSHACHETSPFFPATDTWSHTKGAGVAGPDVSEWRDVAAIDPEADVCYSHPTEAERGLRRALSRVEQAVSADGALTEDVYVEVHAALEDLKAHVLHTERFRCLAEEIIVRCGSWKILATFLAQLFHLWPRIICCCSYL
jgi:hypothetical protein